MEEILLNPNLVYLFIIGGFSLAFMAVLTPGTGILEITALFLLLLAGWGIFNLPINYWALALLIVGVFPPMIALRKTKKKYFLGISVSSLVIGSAFILKGRNLVQISHQSWLGHRSFNLNRCFFLDRHPENPGSGCYAAIPRFEFTDWIGW